MFTKSITFAGLASMASAHVVMTSPAIYPLQGGVINAPLMGGSGAPFPCGTDKFSGVQSTVWKAGSTQNVQFKGTAVHGGGSCQISVTTDLNPHKQSVWKVIKSIEGGCPARNQAGNIEPGSAELPLPEGYDVEVPDLPSGSYTLAWTWFNKIGNREMYMNCAPIEIVGGTGKVNPRDLPDMMVANIGNGCTTKEGVDVEFPDPGENVVRYGSGNYGPPVGQCDGSVADDGPVFNVKIKQDSKSPAKPAATQASAEAPAPSAAEAPVEAPAKAEAPAAPLAEVEAPAAPPAKVEAPAAAPASGLCTEGRWNCIDGKSFSRCASGAWSATIPMAAGTACVVGESETLTLA